MCGKGQIRFIKVVGFSRFNTWYWRQSKQSIFVGFCLVFPLLPPPPRYLMNIHWSWWATQPMVAHVLARYANEYDGSLCPCFNLFEHDRNRRLICASKRKPCTLFAYLHLTSGNDANTSRQSSKESRTLSVVCHKFLLFKFPFQKSQDLKK